LKSCCNCKKERYKHRRKFYGVTQIRLFSSSAQVCFDYDRKTVRNEVKLWSGKASSALITVIVLKEIFKERGKIESSSFPLSNRDLDQHESMLNGEHKSMN